MPEEIPNTTDLFEIIRTIPSMRRLKPDLVFGPVRRTARADVVYEDNWGQPPALRRSIERRGNGAYGNEAR